MQWQEFVKERKRTELEDIISLENLKPEETRSFMDNAIRNGVMKTTGTDIDKIMPPMPRFGGGNRVEKKNDIIDRLQAFFDKYFDL